MENVFEPAFGNRPDCIVGRDEILANIDKALASRPGSRDRAMFVVGQRGMGKTALLLEMESRARKAGYATARAISSERMLDNLLEQLQINGREFVASDKRKVRGVSAGALGFSLGLTFSEEVRENYGFQTKLGLLCKKLGECGKSVLLLVDEVRATSPEMRELAGAYQQLVGDGRDIAICMAGLPASVSNVLNDEVLTFLNRASKVRLEPLSLPSVREYYAASFANAGLPISNDVLDRAVAATRGFPYLLQLIGYYLIAGSQSGGELTDAALDRAISNARDDMEDNVFRPTLAALSAKDIDFLKALARSAGSTGTGSIAEVRGALEKDNGYVQVYRKRLLDAGVVVSPRSGELEFAVPLLAEYLMGRRGA